MTRHIPRTVPIVLHPDDTVTDADMAIALAQMGASSCSHKNSRSIRQLAEVDRFQTHERR